MILAALTMSACAPPGASSVDSFMTAMHPTEDFCASRGLTLDPTTKQCATPARPSAEVTGSLPSQGAKKSPQLQPQAQPQQPQAQPQPQAPQQQAQPQAQPLPPPVVHVPPPAAAVQPPADRLRGTLAVPVEPDATIDPKLQQDVDFTSELAHFVRASGYRCDSISALRRGSEPHRFTMACNRAAYKYAIEDKDGRWSVTVE